MKRFSCALALLALIVLVPPSTVLGAEVDHFRGKTASAEFYSIDPTGCVVTSVTAFANESRSFSPQVSREANAWADITVYQFNLCTGAQFSCGAASFDLPDGAFNVANPLASATLTLAGDLYDYCTGTDRSITVNLTWTGSGDLSSYRSHYSLDSPGYHVTYRQSGQQREAAITGSVTVDGVSLPLDNGYGYLSNATNGTVTRLR